MAFARASFQAIETDDAQLLSARRRWRATETTTSHLIALRADVTLSRLWSWSAQRWRESTAAQDDSTGTVGQPVERQAVAQPAQVGQAPVADSLRGRCTRLLTAPQRAEAVLVSCHYALFSLIVLTAYLPGCRRRGTWPPQRQRHQHATATHGHGYHDCRDDADMSMMPIARVFRPCHPAPPRALVRSVWPAFWRGFIRSVCLSSRSISPPQPARPPQRTVRPGPLAAPAPAAHACSTCPTSPFPPVHHRQRPHWCLRRYFQVADPRVEPAGGLARGFRTGISARRPSNTSSCAPGAACGIIYLPRIPSPVTAPRGASPRGHVSLCKPPHPAP